MSEQGLESPFEQTLFKEKLHNPEKVCVVLSTYYPDYSKQDKESINEKIDDVCQRRLMNEPVDLGEETELSDNLRGSLAVESLQQLINQGVRVVIVDGGSSDSFRNEVSNIGGTLLYQKEKGYSESRREGIKHAFDQVGKVGVIMQMEPEKVSLTSPEMMSALINPVSKGECDLTILDRGFKIGEISEDTNKWFEEKTEENYAGYPAYQAHSETYLNKIMSNILREVSGKGDLPDFDLLNGTRVFSAKLYGDFMNVIKMDSKISANPDQYFNAVYLAPFLMASRGMVGRIRQVDYVSLNKEPFYPKLQAKLEKLSPSFKAKRDKQREQLETEILAWKDHYDAMSKGKMKETPIQEIRNATIPQDLRVFFKNYFSKEKIEMLTQKTKEVTSNNGIRYKKTIDDAEGIEIYSYLGLERDEARFLRPTRKIDICRFELRGDHSYEMYSEYGQRRDSKPFGLWLNKEALSSEFEAIFDMVTEYLKECPDEIIEVRPFNDQGMPDFLLPRTVNEKIEKYVVRGNIKFLKSNQGIHSYRTDIK
jgi:hypothetical protein